MISHKCRYSCFARVPLSCEMTKLTRTNGPTSGLRAKGQLPRPILAYIQRRQKLLFCNNFFFLFPPNHQTFLILFVRFVRNRGVVMIFFLQYLPIVPMKVQVFFCFRSSKLIIELDNPLIGGYLTYNFFLLRLPTNMIFSFLKH